jgi:hypothetical protein
MKAIETDKAATRIASALQRQEVRYLIELPDGRQLASDPRPRVV